MVALCWSTGRRHRLFLTLLWVSCCSNASSFQVLMHGTRRGAPPALVPEDEAVLDSPESRQDLPCALRPVKAVLGFDLRFQAGYTVTVPWEELAQLGDELRVLVRVTPTIQRGRQSYLAQRVTTPAVPEDSGEGEAAFDGRFDVGEGRYDVAWLMRNRSGRVCSFHWNLEAALTGKDRDLPLALNAGDVQASESNPFAQESSVDRGENATLRLALLVNLTPPDANSIVLREDDLAAIAATLRNIVHDPEVRELSLTAFQLRDPRVLYRQTAAAQIDFPELGRAFVATRTATVSISTLSRQHPDEEFLATLIRDEVERDYQPDALVFVGPRLRGDEGISHSAPRSEGSRRIPIFYLNHDSAPQVPVWKDAIGQIVKTLHGQEYTFSRPAEMWKSIRQMLSQIRRLAAQSVR